MNAFDPALAAPDNRRVDDQRPVTIAILAMGGQGGAVLADWIVALAEGNNWVAQSTSVPGVAQRTGATIYYLEIIPARNNEMPVLSLMPVPGDVDIVLAAEWMEGGRAMMRGLVTPDRTTLIASTHRSLAVGEKEKPGNGAGDPAIVAEAMKCAARHTIAFDMATLAEKNGSVISATLFGALAGSGAMPFSRAAFEKAIRAGGVGVDGSLRAFAAAFEQAQAGVSNIELRDETTAIAAGGAFPANTGHVATDRLLARIRDEIPQAAQAMAMTGVERMLDWQDASHAALYLDRLKKCCDACAQVEPKQRDELCREWARHLAIAMAYDDIFRVADLKIRASRFARIRKEIGIADEQIFYTTEFMHPRMEEFCSVLPVKWGLALEARPRLMRALDKFVNRGRRVRTGTIFWYLTLYAIAGLKRFRLAALRHQRETAHLENWMAEALRHLPQNPALAGEIIKTRRLIKGYSDTHARGLSKYDRVMSAVQALESRDDAADWIRRLVHAALQDENGVALDGALKTIAEFTTPLPHR